MVAAMDEAVGTITDTFKEEGLWDDTFMVFSTGSASLTTELTDLLEFGVIRT